MYATHVENELWYTGINSPEISYKLGLEISDKVKQYLSKKEAILVQGPAELASTTIQSVKMAGEWVYHLDDTTLCARIVPQNETHDESDSPYKNMNIRFATAGKKSKKIIKDLQNIVEEII